MPFTEAEISTASVSHGNPSQNALFAKLGINVGACLFSTCLLAQTTNPPPLQGTVDPVTEQRRQLERENALRERQERGVDIKPENTPSPPPTVCLRVKRRAFPSDSYNYGVMTQPALTGYSPMLMAGV